MSTRSFTLIETVLAAALLAAMSVAVVGLMRAVRMDAHSRARTQSVLNPDAPRPSEAGPSSDLTAWLEQLRHANVDGSAIPLGQDGWAWGVAIASRPAWITARMKDATSHESRWVLVETADGLTAKWYPSVPDATANGGRNR